MKKRLISLCITIICSSNLLFAQTGNNLVGINTLTPQQTFHVDPKANTLTEVSTQSDDVVFTEDGIVGLGTIFPEKDKKLNILGNVKIAGTTTTRDTVLIKGTGKSTNIGLNVSEATANLHLKSTSTDQIGLRIVDGTEIENGILTANESGNAYWDQLKPMSTVLVGKLKSGVTFSTSTSITQDSLSLSPGRWLVLAKSAVTGYNIAGFYVYMNLMVEAGFNGSTTGIPFKLGTNGSSAEQVNGSAYAATPNLVYVVDVPVKAGVLPGTPEYNTKFWIALSCSRTTRTSESYGNMQFYALRIDRPL